MRRFFPLVPLFVVLSFILAPRAGAESIEWEENPQFIVEVDGKPSADIVVYQPTVSKPYLVLVFAGRKTILLLDLSSKTVFDVTGRIRFNSECKILSNGIPEGRSVGKYRVEQSGSLFAFKGKTMLVKLRDPLVGEVSLGILLAHSQEYAILRDRYKPRRTAVEELRKVKKPTEIVVLFATWCSTCKAIVPKFIRVMAEAANPAFHVRYIGISMGGDEPRAALERYGKDYPAIIVFQNGVEKGRIIGNPTLPVEQYLVSILNRR
ncbi:MAG: thioredoxin family protein [Bacteroidota bacterium]|nr:thioredoxin family protein [Bacteroidota bacterium]